jgi:hypothetical protein
VRWLRFTFGSAQGNARLESVAHSQSAALGCKRQLCATATMPTAAFGIFHDGSALITGLAHLEWRFVYNMLLELLLPLCLPADSGCKHDLRSSQPPMTAASTTGMYTRSLNVLCYST